MKRSLPLILLAGVLLLPGALAGETHQIDVIAHEEPADCVDDEGPCLSIPADAWSLVSEGDELEVTFENNGTQPHGLGLVQGDLADETNGTAPEDAFLLVDAIEPGERIQANATVPNGTDAVHLFCPVGDHEPDGMHLLRNVYPAGSVEEARERGPGLDHPDESPGAGLTGLIVALMAALTARAR